jgi:hypothetical protein
LIFAGSSHLTLDAAGLAEGTVLILIPKSKLKTRKTALKLSVYQHNQKLEEIETTFIAPED